MIEKYSGDLLLTPCPTVLVTVKHKDIENVLTVSWAGIASSHPEHVTIAINSKRFSHTLITQSSKFCICIPSFDMLDFVDFCGSVSGRNVDKFAACGFKKNHIGEYVLIEQCKFHILCDVVNIIELGSHHLFIAKVAGKYYDSETSEHIHKNLDPIAYFRPYYYRLERSDCGFYGYTMRHYEEKQTRSTKLNEKATLRHSTTQEDSV